MTGEIRGPMALPATLSARPLHVVLQNRRQIDFCEPEPPVQHFGIIRYRKCGGFPRRDP